MNPPPNYVVVDLEATCWESGTRLERMEIIEIGAVYLLGETLTIRDEFDSFVKPIQEPVLSEFCRNLTSIQQNDVATADIFPAVLERFCDWLGSTPVTMCSWGAYDWRQLQQDCNRHEVPFPGILQAHVNLKTLFARSNRGKPRGLMHALRILNLPLEGTHHRGIDDARNITKIARLLLPSATNPGTNSNSG